jgi:hypothetical protein
MTLLLFLEKAYMVSLATYITVMDREKNLNRIIIVLNYESECTKTKERKKVDKKEKTQKGNKLSN